LRWFALAATTVMLVHRFGHVTAYWAVAGGLALIGAMVAIIVSARERDEEIAEQVAEKAGTEKVVGSAAAQAVVQTPIALLGALFTSSPATAIGGVRLLAKKPSIGPAAGHDRLADLADAAGGGITGDRSTPETQWG
jgi:hypothetical protein